MASKRKKARLYDFQQKAVDDLMADYTSVMCEKCHSHWIHCTCKDPKLTRLKEIEDDESTGTV